MMFVDFTSVSAFGEDGLLWQSGNLVSDELSIQKVEEEQNVVTCVGWDAYTGTDVAVRLGLQTGEILKATTPAEAESGVIKRWRRFP